MNAYQFLAGRRRERDMAMLLGVIALGTSEDSEGVKKQVDKWESDQ